MMDGFDRQDSRKRRRLSERRRVFSRIGLNNNNSSSSKLVNAKQGSLSSDKSWSSSSQQQHQSPQFANQTMERQQSNSSRSDSPLSEGSKISMKIQFHITVAPEHEPLILDASSLSASSASTPTSMNNNRKKSIESIGDQIHERLTRQNTLSTRRRQQLLAMHNKMALDSEGPTRSRANSARCERDGSIRSKLEDDSTLRSGKESCDAPTEVMASGGRDTGARASTFTGGISDEATVRFLAQHQSRPPTAPEPLGEPRQLEISGQPHMTGRQEKEHIYFKRDGQRFGHEFTLKLAVDRNYRCLLKVRPLIPLQSISIQGHHVLFADCSQTSSGAAATPSSAPASSSVLNRSWQDVRQHQNHQSQARHNQHLNHHTHHINNNNNNNNHHHNYRLNHAQTTSNLSRASLSPFNNKIGFLYQQQQNQMMRYFAASHCSSSSNSHLGSQLIYMFDWSASRFEVNKNKARTEIQTVLKFKNGQILSLPLQVKFYQSDCRQHLSWGSQLHFIDYECNINNLGQISVERVQYY